MEIQIYVTKDDYINKNVDIQAPSFTMLTTPALNILRNKELGANSFAVYCVILKHRNMETNKCFPSIKTIAKESGISDKTVKKIINKLECNGYLSINSGMRGISNNYYFPKEWFYILFNDDYYQKNATRKHNILLEKRETKLEKENKELREENENLKAQNRSLRNNTNKFDEDSPF